MSSYARQVLLATNRYGWRRHIKSINWTGSDLFIFFSVSSCGLLAPDKTEVVVGSSDLLFMLLNSLEYR